MQRKHWHWICAGFVSALMWLGIVWLFASCTTYEAVLAAPEEFWLTAEEIVCAIALDLWSLVEMFL